MITGPEAPGNSIQPDDRRIAPDPDPVTNALPTDGRSVNVMFDHTAVGGLDGACGFADKIDMCDNLLCGESECFGHHKLAHALGTRWFSRRAPINEIFTMRSTLKHQQR